MNKDILIKYLLASNTSFDTVNDIYFNNIELLLRLDANTNSLGLPYYRDYSTKQRQVRHFTGTSSLSDIQFVNTNDVTYPDINTVNNINIGSFLYIPNKYNHISRISELNTGTFISTIKGTYLEVMLNGLNSPHNFDTQDFTIELSFYADEMNLPWRYQTLFSVGESFYINENVNLSNIGTTYGTFRTPFGLFLQKNELIFHDTVVAYSVATSLEKLKWYHVAIQRKGNTFEFYLNFIKIKTVSFTSRDYIFTTVTNTDTALKRLTIGATNNYVTNVPLYGTQYTTNSHIDWTFSGGLSNFRITKGIARYSQPFYSPQLPYYIADLQNRLDANYNDVLYFTPFTYDLYDYSKYKSHFTNQLLISKLPANYTTGFLEINGKNKYESDVITTNLNASEWTIEFYYTLFVNHQPIKTTSGDSHIIDSINHHFSVIELLNTYTIASQADSTHLDKKYNLISITSNDKKVLNIDLRWLIDYYYSFFIGTRFSNGLYFSIKASIDGDTWIDFQNNEGKWVNDTAFITKLNLPKDELKIFRQSSGQGTETVFNTTNIFKGAYSEPLTHIAIQRYNNLIYLFINGVMFQAFPFEYTLFSSLNDTKINIDSYTETDIEATNTGINYILSQGIKGLRVTNKARYNTSLTNEYFASHSQYPVALNSSSLAPPRARILNILKIVTLSSVSTDFVEWNIYLSQQVDNLLLADFSLTQLEGVQDAALISLIKISEYLYTVKASTGTGNGLLGLNFIDRKTVKYKGKNTYISINAGELSFEGEFYTINKDNPTTTLTSGSNPYVKSDFEIDVTFNGSISTFNPDNIGIVNGTLKNSVTIDALLQHYRITVTPVTQEAVIVKAMEGTGLSDNDIVSQQSNTLVRIYAESFSILQVPLNISNTRNDLSPAKLILNEVISNNTGFSNSIAPFGETSSLFVSPTLEQSGLILNNYNAVASTSTQGVNEDWTIEFYLRINSNGLTSHIFSIEDPSTGICFIATNKQLKIQRTITNTSILFASLNYADIDTPNFVLWDDTTKTIQQKYPHFAITKQGTTYRFYRNGIRVQLIQSDITIDVSKGDLHLGYYINYVTHADFYFSNLRVTLGKALYTSAVVNIPGLPYNILPNITDKTELISYISIYSNNYKSNRATLTDKITLKFVSIIPLENIPIVTISNKLADVQAMDFNTYLAVIQVDENTLEGNATFLISISNEPNIPDKEFSNTTNNSFVIVDKAALIVTITTDEPNNDNYLFDIYVTFSEDTLTDLTLDLLTTNNSRCSNLFKYANQNRYRITLEALTSSDFSIKLDANKIKDLAGNFNLASDEFIRTAIVPSYIPDVYWNNVIFLLQSEINIIDESNNQIEIINNNVTLTTENSPIGLSKSLKFNGASSSLSFQLNETLPSNIDWAIEFYIYIKSSTVIKLAKPTILPSSNITSSTFKANWQPTIDADGYKLDISKEAAFDSYLPGFKQRDVGSTNTFDVSLDVDDNLPIFSNIAHISSNGIVTKYLYSNDKNIGYYIDISLTNNFSKKLYKYNNLFTTQSYIAIGSNSDLKEIELYQTLDNALIGNTNSLGTGTILTGLFTQDNYPKLLYILEESSVRLYPSNDYVLPGMIEDLDIAKWTHIALVNKANYCSLFRDGELEDKVKDISWTNDLISLGHNIGYINALISGVRISKGIARYTTPFIIPKLPFSKN